MILSPVLRSAPILAVMVATALQAQDPPHRRFTVKDGLPSNTVYHCVQDREGYMWFSTEAGACRFDGAHFEVFGVEDGLPDNEVIEMVAAPDGRTWFLGFNGRVSYYHQGRFHTAESDSLLARIRSPRGFVNASYDQYSGVWFGGMMGDVFHWTPERVEHFVLEDSIDGQPKATMTRILSRGAGGMMFVCGATLYVTRNEVPVRLRQWKCGYGRYPSGFTHRDEAIGQTDDGFVVLADEGDRRLANLPTGILGHSRLPVVDRFERIWRPLYGGGLQRNLIADPERQVPTWYPHILFNAVFEDHEGNIWLTTDGNGVLLISSAQADLEQYRSASPSENTTIHSICVHPFYGVVCGDAFGGLFTVRPQGLGRIFQAPPGGTLRNRVRAIAGSPSQELWIATDSWCGYLPAGNGHPVPMPHYDHINGRFFDDGAKTLAIAKDGRIAVSYFGVGQVTERAGRRCMVYDGTLWPSSERCYALCYDSLGRLWSEHEARLRCTDGGRYVEFPELDPEFGLRITGISAMDANTMAIATTGAGIKIVRDGQVIRKFTTAEGLCGDQVRKVRVHQGRLLAATDGGAAVITDPLGLGTISTITLTSGLPTNDVLDIDADDRSLWMATAEGLVRAPLDRTSVIPEPLRARFMSWRTPDSTVVLNGRMEIPLGTRGQLHAWAFSYAAPQAIQYAFREESDSVWSASAAGVFDLRGLGPGTHQYEVRARRTGQTWGPAAALVIEVIPPWHARTWFRLLLLALITAGGILLVRHLSHRRLKQHLIELERAQALDHERHRIATEVHDDLGADVSHLLMLARQTVESHTLPKEDIANVALIEDHASGLARKVDEIIWSLDARDDRMLTTIAFIQRQVENTCSQLGITFRTTPVTGPDGPMPSRARRELYLLLREMLNNIVKHSEPRTVRFEVGLTATVATFTLEHDGRGHEGKGNGRARGGYGQENMRQRLERLQGEVVTTSAQGLFRTTIHIRRDQYPSH